MYEVVKGSMPLDALCADCPVRKNLSDCERLDVTAQSFPENSFNPPVTTVMLASGDNMGLSLTTIEGPEVQAVSEIETQLLFCEGPTSAKGFLGRKVLRCAVLQKR